MAHEITVRQDGKAEIAYVGERPWHCLGTKLDQDATIETWIKEAGLDWEAQKSMVKFMADDGMTSFQGKSVIYRSDSLSPLGIVSDEYKIVQPREVVEFFKEAAGQANMKLEVAGSLFGGRRFWATARVAADELKLNGVDVVRPYVLLITSVDGTLATTATLVNTRVVCANTARVALNENGERVRVTHAANFDSNLVKNQLGLIDGAWSNFKDRITKMAQTKVDSIAATDFFLKLVSDEKSIEQSLGIRRKVDDLMKRFTSGIGSEMHKETAWGLYSAITERTNYQGRGAADVRMQSAIFGPNDKLVQKGEKMIAEMFL